MLSARMTLFGWCSGIAGSFLIIAGFFAVDEGGSAGPDAPIATLVSEILPQRNRIIVGSMVGVVGALFLLWFAAFLRTRLARDGERGALIGSAAFGAGVIVTIGAFLHASFRLALVSSHDGQLLGDAIRPLAILGAKTTSVLFWGMVAVVIALSVASFLLRCLPRALAIAGVALAVGTLALSATDRGGIALALFIWLIAAFFIGLARDRRTTG